MSAQLTEDLHAIATTIRQHRYFWTNEYQLQDSLEKVLLSAFAARHVVIREHRLLTGDRLDFIVGRIAVEVKVKGSLTYVIRQLARYAKSDEVDGIVLVSTVARLTQAPAEIFGKPVVVASLLGDLL